MRMTAMLLLAATLQISAAAFSQGVSITTTNSPLPKVFSQIRQQTGYSFFWDQQLLDKMQPVSVNIRNASLEDALEACLKGLPLTFVIKADKKAVFIKAAQTAPVSFKEDAPALSDLRGRITNEKNEPIPGVSIVLKGTARGALTAADGTFELKQLPEGAVILVRMVGFETQEIRLNGRTTLDVKMKVLPQQISEVTVSTGIFSRKKESFTGSYSVYTGEQLKTIGNQNIVQSLRTLDPSFLVMENNLAGSNPNVMPNLSIQGKTSMIGATDQLKNDPNQPLFIMDGFETDLATIIGLDMNRVASITILKDAASTALYGSKAANGVVVVETKLPRNGKMSLSFTTDNSLSFADLHDYNMMDAAEILQFQKQVGVYSAPTDKMEDRIRLDSIYNRRLSNVQRGVNTYWMGAPLVPTAYSQNYSIYVDGGDHKFRYGLGLKYGQTPGVMKGSGRNTGNANIDLMYRTGKFSFTNKLLLTSYKATESPYGSYSQYVTAMPYFVADTAKYLESIANYNTGNPPTYERTPNPLYQIGLPNKNETNNLQISNRFSAFYQATKYLRFDARFAVTKNNTSTEILRAPQNSEFDNKDVTQRGLYSNSKNDNFFYQGFLQGSYGQVFNGKHEVNIVPGFQIDNTTNVFNAYSVTGFPAGSFLSPSLGTEYPEGEKPSYGRNVTRAMSGFANFHYGYDRRYMFDFNYRKDGSSVFGSNRRFTDTWTVGLAWNLHNEAFMKQSSIISYMQLRASIGNPGNQSFGSYNSFTTLNYYGSMINDNGSGLVVGTWGNPDLAWQKTLNKTIGFEGRLFKDRLSATLNIYDKFTDPLVVSLPNAPSVGSSTQMINIGNLRTQGIDFTLIGTVISIPKDRIYWRVNVSGGHYNATYGGIGNSLDILNGKNQSANGSDSLRHDMASNNATLQRYRDGAHPDDLWAVRSLGIDPGTGREIFLTKEGMPTFTYNERDIVKVGNSQPTIQGVVGTSFQWGGFTASLNMRYILNSYQFNSALYTKAENINSSQMFTSNLDKRALYGHWQKPGDVVPFKYLGTVDGAGSITYTPMSSRFIQKENALSGESISFGYDFYGAPWLKKAGMQGLRVTGYMNEIFRLSTIQRERGLDYPYARSVSFSLNATF
ncbi:SusC/RagA family TonB-linked outer membrane protein [Chitinophaga arvensicola]|uniref:TonB-linked outer membrane protein, SusC/RagA family n=1 Tax=Chitinophaga arvensicola TaxID=29529 RepID=A0A1I0S8W0_9BACT|nr:SusC/RagA family TonB-linked outer membrane protein [Chitinophaga arvensicola]SEW52564.1 TonB-linked outer membrane protein, SusC/RagA family [Chitinophaga arvensicola]